MKFVKKYLTRAGSVAAWIVVGTVLAQQVWAQSASNTGTGSQTINEAQAQLQKGSQGPSALGTQLFGEQVDLYTGALSFLHTDVVLAGNSDLPVQISRIFKAGRDTYTTSVRGHFGDWDLEIPHLTGVYSNAGWLGRDGSGARCSKFGAPPAYIDPANPSVSWANSLFWSGVSISAPGVQGQEVLRRDLSNTKSPSDGNDYPLVTRDSWQLRCLPSLANGLGEGFVALSPQGVQYQFDWIAKRNLSLLQKGKSYMSRDEVWLMPTQVRDRFGNTLSYSYDPNDTWKLLKIESSDGRQISLSYTGSLITAVTDGVRTWSYQYDTEGRLIGVTQPDASQWQFDLKAFAAGAIESDVLPSCAILPDYPTTPLVARITHPSGAVGTFTTQFVVHQRYGAPDQCLPLEDKQAGSASFASYFVWPKKWKTQALVNKQISGPGLSPLSWAYEWRYGEADVGADAKAVYVTDPRAVVTRYTYGARFNVNEGQQLRVQEGWDGTQALRTTSQRYRDPAGMPYPEPVGQSDVLSLDPLTVRHRPVDRREVLLQGQSFVWQAQTFDDLARATQITRSGPAGSRAEVSTYADHLGLWVLGQIASLQSGSLTPLENEYDSATALPVRTKKFGLLQNSFAFNSDGTLSSRTDARGNTTQFSHYKRGHAQQVNYPDGSSESAVVNDIGLIESITGAAGYTTTYGYDAIGRLASVNPPSGWTGSSFVFEPVDSAEFDLAAGHWRHTTSKGSARSVIYFDALWRPLMSRSWDDADEGNTRKVTVTQYDSQGQVAYVSYPQRDIASISANPPGTRNSYDALGRITSTSADSELGQLSHTTEYLDNFVKRQTDPRGKSSTTSFWALDNPQEALLAGSVAPEGVNLAITRDTFGKPLSITRSGSNLGYSANVTRRYVYDAAQRLCKIWEPEVGATVQDYDAAGNIAWRAPGQNLPSTNSCDTTAAAGSARISFTYDSVNRLTTTTYGDGSPNVTRGYTLDGLLSSLVSDGSTWSYSYNSLRKLSDETLSYGGNTYVVSRAYDPLGYLSALIYPNGGPAVTYSPNALGQARTVSGYARNVTYHPDGTVAGYTLANGVVHSLSQNVRGLPELNRDAGLLSDRYSYDANGNVVAITDEQDGLFNRSMNYDDLDRLRGVNAPNVWGIASYEYDPVNNLRKAIVGSRNYQLNVDANNRLSQMVYNGVGTSYGYDANGNISSRGSQSYVFDLGNRLRQASGKSSYAYDGEGYRIGQTSADGAKQTQFYSHSAGKLLFGQMVAGSIPATLASYSCPAGTTLSGSNCISTSSSPAAIASYSCPSGYTQSGSTCSKTANTTVQATVSGYTCPAGSSVSGSDCLSTVSQAATLSGYSCPAGYTLSGSSCSRTNTSTTAATPNYSCPAGQTLSVTSCMSTSSSPATPSYSCPGGYTLAGSNCNGTVTTAADLVQSCLSSGPLRADGACLVQRLSVPAGGDPPSAQCMDLARAVGLKYLRVRTVSANTYDCYIGPVNVYSCPAGATLSGSNCLTSNTVSATVNSYSCASGTLSGSSCLTTSSSAAAISYSCPAGQTVSGSNCTATSTDTLSATPVYSCPSGYSLAGNTCSTTLRSAGTPVYACSAGYVLFGSTCSTSTTSSMAATPNYSCPAGQALSGTSCLASSSISATPAFTCPNGGNLSGTQCVGSSGPSSTTAYVYLGSKLIAEHDSVSGVQFSHTDALGSPVARSNEKGAVVSRSRYEAYGGVAQGFTPTRPNSIGFTGHVNDADTGLVYMQQRYYDPIASRFMSVDPVTTDASTGASFNRYEYASSNPYRFTDPSGMVSEDKYQRGSIHNWKVNGLPKFLGLTTFASWKKDTTLEEAVREGGLTRGVTTPLVGVALAPSALGLVGSAGVAAIGAVASESAVAGGVAANEAGAVTEISIGARATRNSSNQLNVASTQAQAIENLAANGYAKTMSKDGTATIMTLGDKTYRFYPKSTGGGVPGAPAGVPSASVSLFDKIITKLRFYGE